MTAPVSTIFDLLEGSEPVVGAPSEKRASIGLVNVINELGLLELGISYKSAETDYVVYNWEPNTELYFYRSTLKVFTNSVPKRFVPFYIEEGRFRSDRPRTEEQRIIVDAYYTLGMLFPKLQSISVSDSGDELTLFGAGAFAVECDWSINVSCVDLGTSVSLKAVWTDLEARVFHAVHTTERIAIFREVLYEVIARKLDSDSLRPTITLGRIIELLPKLRDAFIARYDVYCADHRPEKVIKEARRDALGYMEQIQKVFQGVQTQVLAVPAAGVLAVLQAKNIKESSGFPWFGVLSLSLSLLFLAFVYMFLRQARAQLQGLKAEWDAFLLPGTNDEGAWGRIQGQLGPVRNRVAQQLVSADRSIRLLYALLVVAAVIQVVSSLLLISPSGSDAPSSSTEEVVGTPLAAPSNAGEDAPEPGSP